MDTLGHLEDRLPPETKKEWEPFLGHRPDRRRDTLWTLYSKCMVLEKRYDRLLQEDLFRPILRLQHESTLKIGKTIDLAEQTIRSLNSYCIALLDFPVLARWDHFDSDLDPKQRLNNIVAFTDSLQLSFIADERLPKGVTPEDFQDACRQYISNPHPKLHISTGAVALVYSLQPPPNAMEVKKKWFEMGRCWIDHMKSVFGDRLSKLGELKVKLGVYIRDTQHGQRQINTLDDIYKICKQIQREASELLKSTGDRKIIEDQLKRWLNEGWLRDVNMPLVVINLDLFVEECQTFVTIYDRPMELPPGPKSKCERPLSVDDSPTAKSL